MNSNFLLAKVQIDLIFIANKLLKKIKFISKRQACIINNATINVSNGKKYFFLKNEISVWHYGIKM